MKSLVLRTRKTLYHKVVYTHNFNLLGCIQKSCVIQTAKKKFLSVLKKSELCKVHNR